MAALPSRKSLENMKRVDLQRICKDYGVKANLKSEALIDLLLDTQKPPSKSAPTRRVVSTRFSSRAGPSRISSVIIHDTDEEDADEEQEAEDANSQRGPSDGPGPNIQPMVEPEQPLPPMTRTRKAKEQTRLGVGRPVAAGGAGPRAVTKSMSVPRTQRGKGSRTMKQSEATILEEEPEPSESMQDSQTIPNDDTLNRETHSNNTNVQDTQNTFSNNSLASLETIDKHVADALRPLHEQMESLKTELELMQSLKTELNQLKAEVDDVGALKLKVETLTAEVRELRTQAASTAVTNMEFRQWRDSMTSSVITKPTLKTPPLFMPSGSAGQTEPRLITHPDLGLEPPSSSIPSNMAVPQPGTPPTMLGKRHRDSSTSDMTDLIEEGDESGILENDLAQKIIKPTKKRPKIFKDDEESKTGAADPTPEEEKETSTRVPNFTIFTGPDEPPEQYLDPPPPTERLPDFFAPPSPPLGFSRQGATATSTATASENQQPFGFSFLPISSTPAHSMFMPSFPYPEPPQSPSPAGTSSTGFLNHHQGERTDVFQAFGLPSPVRPSRPSALRTTGAPSRFVDPAELMRRASSKDGEGGLSKNAAAVGQSRIEPTASGSGSGIPTDAPEMKRTMYGTELDGDTRFGDFGVEGVGTSGAGFWAGGRY